MIRWFHKVLSGKDNESPDMARVLWALSILAVIACEIGAIFLRGQAFEPHTFAVSLAMLLAAGGFGVSIKATTEPDPR